MFFRGSRKFEQASIWGKFAQWVTALPAIYPLLHPSPQTTTQTQMYLKSRETKYIPYISPVTLSLVFLFILHATLLPHY